MTKLGYKYYWRIPFGEVQYGKVSRSLTIWFRGKAYRVRKGKWSETRYKKLDHGKPRHACYRNP